MQKGLIMLIILINNNQEVKCNSVYESVFNRMEGIKDFFGGMFSTIRTRIDDVFQLTNTGKKTALSHVNNNVRKFQSLFKRPPVKGPDRHSANDERASIVEKDPVQLFCNKPLHILTTPQLAATQGRIIETHVVYTFDGYILTLHRLRSSIRSPKNNHRHKKRTILIHHGLLGSSADWLLLGPKKSLPYILSNEGHDVWLTNARGNYYSRAHISKHLDSDEYWDFSWQEMGERDLPAVLNYIRKANNSTEPIDYIGHSMGATALLALLSVEHNYNSYFRIAFLLAPLIFMEHTQGPMRDLSKLDKAFVVSSLGRGEFMPSRRIPQAYASKLCYNSDWKEKTGAPESDCRNPLFFLAGGPLQEGTRTSDAMDQLQEYVPAGGSVKTILHYIDLVESGKFHHFGKPDWKYKLKYVSTPLLILSSNDDVLSNATDNQMLYLSVLNPLGHIIIKNQDFSHTEFAWGFNADVLIYYKIRDLIDLGPDVIKV